VRVWRTHGTVLAAVGLLTDRGPACTLTASVRVAIRHRRGGAPVALGGNPARWKLATSLEPWAARVHVWGWRSWCGRARGFVFTADSPAQHALARLRAPACRSGHARSRVIDLGGGTKRLPFTGDRIPAHMLDPDVPPPVSAQLIRVTNGWLVSDGRTVVAVYAGEAGEDAGLGRFVVIRQNLVFGSESNDVVNVGRAGAVRITAAPRGAAVEASAQRGDIRFASTTGAARGVLHLARDEVELTP
jgi:hypothetical protein